MTHEFSANAAPVKLRQDTDCEDIPRTGCHSFGFAERKASKKLTGLVSNPDLPIVGSCEVGLDHLLEHRRREQTDRLDNALDLGNVVTPDRAH